MPAIGTGGTGNRQADPNADSHTLTEAPASLGAGETLRTHGGRHIRADSTVKDQFKKKELKEGYTPKRKLCVRVAARNHNWQVALFASRATDPGEQGV